MTRLRAAWAWLRQQARALWARLRAWWVGPTLPPVVCEAPPLLPPVVVEEPVVERPPEPAPGSRLRFRGIDWLYHATEAGTVRWTKRMVKRRGREEDSVDVFVRVRRVDCQPGPTEGNWTVVGRR